MREFKEAMDEEMKVLAARLKARWQRDLVRDGRGLPTVEEELGWRTAFRGTEGGKD